MVESLRELKEASFLLLDFCLGSQENEIRGRLLGGVLSFFWVCERVDLREDSRELPSTFLKRKRDKSEVRIQIFAWTRGK